MKKLLQSASAFLWLVVCLTVFTWAVKILFHWVFEGANPTVIAAIVAAVATTLVSVLSVVVGRYLERRAAIAADIRAAKMPVYKHMVGTFMTLLGFGDERSEDVRHAEAVRTMQGLTPELLLWAGDEVLAKWSRYRRRALTYRPSSPCSSSSRCCWPSGRITDTATPHSSLAIFSAFS